MIHTNEKAVAGRVSGLIELNEIVTWEAKHLFKTRRLTSKITAMNAPLHFRDEMIKGDFKSMVHHHYFRPVDGGTEMKDVFKFEAPYGIVGILVEMLFLKRYLSNLLQRRNAIIKAEAEKLL